MLSLISGLLRRSAPREKVGFYDVIASQRVRFEAAGPMTGSAKQSSAAGIPSFAWGVKEDADDEIRRAVVCCYLSWLSY